jgi:hypothetical protein
MITNFISYVTNFITIRFFFNFTVAPSLAIHIQHSNFLYLFKTT